MYIINFRMTICIGDVVLCSGRGRITGSCAVDVLAYQASDHSCPTSRIGVVSNFKNLAGNICDEVCLQ